MVLKKKYGLIPLTKQRLDVVLVRANFALTLSQARQLISHRQVYVNGIVITSSFYILKKRDIISVSLSIKKIARENCKQTIQAQDLNNSQYSSFKVNLTIQKLVNTFDSLKINELFKLNLGKLALTTSHQIICVLLLLYSTYFLEFSENYILALFLASFVGNVAYYKVLTKTEILAGFLMLLTFTSYFVFNPCYICVEFPIYSSVALIIRAIVEVFFPSFATIHRYGWYFGTLLQIMCYGLLLIFQVPISSGFCMMNLT